MSYEIVIGIDPGNVGGIAIYENKTITVYPMPTMDKVVNKKKKKVYDLNQIVGLLHPYREKEVLFCIEVQNPRPLEGSVSSFSAGRGYGILLGVAVAMGFDVVEIRPSVWKKHFQLLNTDSMESKKEELSELRKKGKTLKGKAEKKENSKAMEKMSRQIKAEGKKASIALAKKMYPDVDLQIKRSESDGMAEAMLISQYGVDCQDELVRKNS